MLSILFFYLAYIKGAIVASFFCFIRLVIRFLYSGIISICTNQGIIESIACRTDCYINSYFLINADIDDFLSTFKLDKQTIEKDAVFIYDDISQDVYEVDDLGMQIWVDNDNKIVTVFVSPQG